MISLRPCWPGMSLLVHLLFLVPLILGMCVQARERMSNMPDMDWFFCRGYFLQASNSFQGYTPEELGMRDSITSAKML